ncbi:hypothetical protein JB92DRAFT_3108487 [Gautieria morchelliformis]|nr:hypothetical protein JB92DRAFT_3108487 [Gautieria morchelliformis]
MAPLAGKPPFATDEPDSAFTHQSQLVPRPRKQKVDATATGGARDSSYTAFDSYFTGNGPDTRASGVGDIGRGLMDAGSDFDDSSDDEHPPKNKQVISPPEQPSDKHRALYAAAMGTVLSKSPPPSYERDVFASSPDQRQPQQHPDSLRIVKQPQPVVHSREHGGQLVRHLEPSAPAGPIPRSIMPQQHPEPPAALQSGVRPVAAPAPAHSRPPQVAFMQGPTPGMAQIGPSGQGNPYHSGVMPSSGPGTATRTPQPLPPPQSPIMPVFARPRKDNNMVKFEEKGEILRGNSEETLLPRGIGGKGDDFWRRFSMVAKEEAKSGSKKSAWLRKTESGSTRLSTWVWIVGILFLLAIGGGIGVAWVFTHNTPAAAPVAIGGSANEGFTSSTLTPTTASSVKATRVTAAPEPTNTNNNNNKRSVEQFAPSPVSSPHAVPSVPAAHRRSFVDRIAH